MSEVHRTTAAAVYLKSELYLRTWLHFCSKLLDGGGGTVNCGLESEIKLVFKFPPVVWSCTIAIQPIPSVKYNLCLNASPLLLSLFINSSFLVKHLILTLPQSLSQWWGLNTLFSADGDERWDLVLRQGTDPGIMPFPKPNLTPTPP